MRLARFFWMKNDPQVVWRETTEKTVGPSNISRIPLHIYHIIAEILLVHNLFSCVPRFLDFCTGCVYHGYLQESIPPYPYDLPRGSGKYWSQLVCSPQRWIDPLQMMGLTIPSLFEPLFGKENDNRLVIYCILTGYQWWTSEKHSDTVLMHQ